MKILYIDMDETLCKYKEKYQEKRNLYVDIKYPQSQYGFFANLEPIDGAIEAVNKLREKYDVYILSRPSYKNPLSYTEKRIWIEKYFGLEFCKKLILCSDKFLLKGDYLIDDVIQHGFEGEQIQIGVDPFMTWNEIVNYLI